MSEQNTVRGFHTKGGLSPYLVYSAQLKRSTHEHPGYAETHSDLSANSLASTLMGETSSTRSMLESLYSNKSLSPSSRDDAYTRSWTPVHDAPNVAPQYEAALSSMPPGHYVSHFTPLPSTGTDHYTTSSNDASNNMHSLGQGQGHPHPFSTIYRVVGSHGSGTRDYSVSLPANAYTHTSEPFRFPGWQQAAGGFTQPRVEQTVQVQKTPTHGEVGTLSAPQQQTRRSPTERIYTFIECKGYPTGSGTSSAAVMGGGQTEGHRVEGKQGKSASKVTGRAKSRAKPYPSRLVHHTPSSEDAAPALNERVESQIFALSSRVFALEAILQGPVPVPLGQASAIVALSEGPVDDGSSNNLGSLPGIYGPSKGQEVTMNLY